MGYWEEVKDVVVKGINLAAENLKESVELATDKGKSGVAYVQLKKDLFVEQRKLQELLADLGDITLGIVREKKDILTDDRVKASIEKITAKEAECKAIEEKIKNLKL